MPTIQEYVEQRSLATHFQPIVSVKKRAIVGLEALTRGQDGPYRLVAPQQLFQWAAEAVPRMSDALDDLCLVQALAGFAAFPNRPEHLVLFLNLDASRLAHGSIQAATLRRHVEESGLKPQDVVFEFSDKMVEVAPGLRILAEACQSFGFSVALDDIDGSPASLARLNALRPDLAKIDAHLLQGLAKDPVQQELVRSVTGLAKTLGALTVAEGVENEESAAACMDLGADLLQGFHYGRPADAGHLMLGASQGAAELSAERKKAALVGRTQARKRENEHHLQLLKRIQAALETASPEGFDKALAQFVNAVASLECLYVLDRKGTQVTPTVVWRHQKEGQRSRLFAPAAAGADHSLKDYFIGLSLSDQDLYVSEPYVSLATGNPCRTLTTRFLNLAKSEFVLCMDVRSSLAA